MSLASRQIGPRPALRAAVVSLLADRLRERLRTGKTDDVSVLDVGCGNMETSHLIMQELSRRLGSFFRYELKGWDVSEDRVRMARELGRAAEVRDVTASDGLMRVPDHGYDVILMLEVLEHLLDPDVAMTNIGRLLKEDGILVVSTPNLAAWYNRLFLLLGCQPHCAEVSTRMCYMGNPVLRRLLDAGSGQRPAGHLRLFTYRALREFMSNHGFEIVGVRGVSNYSVGSVVARIASVISRIWVGGAGDVVLVAVRKQR